METPKGAFGVLSVTSIWIKDITLLKKKISNLVHAGRFWN